MSSQYMSFVGVSTSGSSIMRVFPVWAEILGLPTRQLHGIDLPLDATAADYRRVVEEISSDQNNLGALVTTHKMGLYTAAHDMFDELDDFSRACAELSSISKRSGRLIGHAKDPLTVGLATQDALPDDHFSTSGGHVFILGAGGAGLALTWYLSERVDAPARIVIVDPSEDRLKHLQQIHATRGTPDGLIETHPADPETVHRILAELPPHSLVVNASGLGKDLPGSPLPEGAQFPENGVVWDFNYRGSLEFLAQAREHGDSLQIIDGWRYFIHGWTQVIAEVFHITLTDDLVEQLAAAAVEVR